MNALDILRNLKAHKHDALIITDRGANYLSDDPDRMGHVDRSAALIAVTDPSIGVMAVPRSTANLYSVI